MKEYLSMLILIILVVAGSGCTDSSNVENNNDQVKVLAQDMQVTKYNETLTTDIHSEAYNITVILEIQNNGSKKLNYIPISVNVTGKDETSNQTYINESVVIFDLKPGEKRNLTFNKTKLSSEPTDLNYQIKIENESSNVNDQIVSAVAYNVLNRTNESSISEKSVIPIKGKLLVSQYYIKSPMTETPENYSANTPVTIIIPGDSHEKKVGTWRVTEYSSGGYGPPTTDTYDVSGYQRYNAFIVIYWPSMKIAGKHTIYGSYPPRTTSDASRAGVYGSSPDPEKWIKSLPRQ